MHVLIADRDPDSETIFRTILEYHQFRVSAAGTAEKAARILADDQPDLVIVGYPFPMPDGRSLTETIRADDRLRHMPILGAVQRAVVELARAARAAGCDQVCEKPIDPRRLAVQVREMVGPSLEH